MFNLYNGDCLEVMKEIETGSVDMILADLPYGTTEAKWDSVIPFNPLWEQFNRIIKDNGAIVLFSAQPFTTKLINSNMKYFRYCWYWKKNTATGGQFAHVQPMRSVEEICVFYKKKPTYNPQGLKRLEKPILNKSVQKRSHLYHFRSSDNLQFFTNYPKNVFEFKAVPKKKHPSEKPVELLKYLIKTYTAEGETVLDCCSGSGSTGEACAETKRRFIGIELSPLYFNVTKNRVEKAYNKIECFT